MRAGGGRRAPPRPLPPRPRRAQLRVRDFASEAAWVDPCRTYVLPDVGCGSCQRVADLDLCRHPAMSEPAEGEARRWLCAHCAHPYDRADVEARLVLVAQRASLGYQLQDARCVKCRALRASHLAPLCGTCGSQFSVSASTATIGALLDTLREVARAFALPYLLEVTTWLR